MRPPPCPTPTIYSIPWNADTNKTNVGGAAVHCSVSAFLEHRTGVSLWCAHCLRSRRLVFVALSVSPSVCMSPSVPARAQLRRRAIHSTHSHPRTPLCPFLCLTCSVTAPLFSLLSLLLAPLSRFALPGGIKIRARCGFQVPCFDVGGHNRPNRHAMHARSRQAPLASHVVCAIAGVVL